MATIIKCDEKSCDHAESFGAGPKPPGFLFLTADTLRHRIGGGWCRGFLAAAEKRAEDQTARWWLVSRSGLEKGYDARRDASLRRGQSETQRFSTSQPQHPPSPVPIPLSSLYLSFSFHFRLTTLSFHFSSLFLFRSSAFLPRTPFHPLHPFSLLSHLGLSVSCAHIYRHTLSPLFLHFTSFGPVQRRSMHRTVRRASIRTY